MAPGRMVVLDDADPSLKYTGPWFQDSSGSQDKVGNLGPPYLRTLHGTSADGTVEFEFNGTGIEVWGTSIVKDFNTDPDPNLECFVNNVSIGRDKPSEFGQNNWRLCRGAQLPDAHHTLRINVKVASKDQTFWLDQLRYSPSPDLPLDNRVILFDSSDPAIQYDKQWMDLGGEMHMTTTKNSVAQVNFIGTSVSWVSFVPAELPHTGATGTWAIDDGKPTQFLLPGLPADEPNPIYSQFFFTTPDVEAAPHTLTVTFLGDNQTTPLSIDYLYVKNGTFPLPTTANNATTTANNPTTTSVNNSTNTPGLNTHGIHNSPSGPSNGTILGSVLGGLAFVIVTAGATLFWRHRNARQKERLIGPEGPGHIPVFFNPSRNNSDSMVQVHKPQSRVASGVSASGVTSIIPTPPAQQPSARRKQQGAARRTTNNEVGQTGRSNELPPRAQVVTTDTSELRQHTDSGLRLSERPVADIPPQYTPY